MDLLGSLLEARGGADDCWEVMEGDTVGELGVLGLLDAGGMLVDLGGVGQRPEVLGGPQFG